MKEFKIEDTQLFPITLSWRAAETEDNEIEVFPKLEKIPLSKLLTIYKREPFEIEARYRFPNNIPFNEPRIGKFYINNVVPNAQGENSEVKLKARITKSGIFEISSPQLIEQVEVAAGEESSSTAKQIDAAAAAAAASTTGEASLQHQASGDADATSEDVNMNEEHSNGPANGGEGQQASAASATSATTQSASAVNKKKKTRAIDLPMTARVPQLTKEEVNIFIETEVNSLFWFLLYFLF